MIKRRKEEKRRKEKRKEKREVRLTNDSIPSRNDPVEDAVKQNAMRK